jgi:radical SAM superfamily enzyme YgiQ (UPF0313 family)
MLSTKGRTIILVQLPIPPLGPEPIRGNVPLAAAYLKLFAAKRGLDNWYDIDLLPAHEANTLGDRALVQALARRRPWLVGFTCYVWNIERTLWIARELKRLLPGVKIVLGGPEITADNAWVLGTNDYDFVAIGEGEQTFAQLLLGILDEDIPPVSIAGLHVRGAPDLPAFRTPLPDLNTLGSPYLAGILDAADEQMLLLETTRGCVFKCKFCYYPKSYDKQYYLAADHILANLRHAHERGAKEVFLLDPTLNQRKDFADFLRLLAQGNSARQFSYFGELRGEGINEETARLLRLANFTEVEVGLQSIDPEAQKQMDRKNNLRAFERGVRAMLNEGIRVKVDLIVGLPGDTAASVRAGLHFLRDTGLNSDVQVFNLSILPGTAFRHEAENLGLTFQPRPPYYLLRTPSLCREDLYELLHEAQELFAVEFDAQPPPVLTFDNHSALARCEVVDLECVKGKRATAEAWTQAFTLWLRAPSFAGHAAEVAAQVRRILDVNPFTTLQVVLEPGLETALTHIAPRFLQAVTAACQQNPTYLDRYYALQPGRSNGAKRLVLLLPLEWRGGVRREWINDVGEFAAVVWHGAGAEDEVAGWEPWEYALAATGGEGRPRPAHDSFTVAPG